jgi:hypothetical protein
LKSTVLPQAEAKGTWSWSPFPWSPLKAALLVLNVSLLKKQFFQKALLKIKKIVIMPNHKLFKNVCLENTLSVVR